MMRFHDAAGARKAGRRLTLAAAFVAIAGVEAATAQTVIVRNAPAAGTVELQAAGSTQSSPADGNGDATFTTAVPGNGAQADVRIHVDECGTLVRVLLVPFGRQPPEPSPGCTRKEMWGVYIMQPVTTFVVDIAGTNTTVHVRQGPAPIEWLMRGPSSERTGGIPWAAPPTGLMISGGGRFASLADARRVACGNVNSCETDGFKGSIAAGVDYWFSRLLAAHVGYVRPARIATAGSGDNFTFNSFVETRLVTIGGKVGASAGPARVYGLGGVARHQATLTTKQTISDSTTVVDTVTVTIPGGTQTLTQKTEGWGWIAGGGVEAWATSRIALYAELQRAKLKGAPLGGGEGGIDDRATSLTFGARIRLTR